MKKALAGWLDANRVSYEVDQYNDGRLKIT